MVTNHNINAQVRNLITLLTVRSFRIKVKEKEFPGQTRQMSDYSNVRYTHTELNHFCLSDHLGAHAAALL